MAADLNRSVLARFSQLGRDKREQPLEGNGRIHRIAGQTMRWPIWWDWELELSPHLLKRMADRRFTEVDLRRMLQSAIRLRRDVPDGRWVVTTRHRRARWEVIVEPDRDAAVLVVITAYPAERESS